MQISFDDAAREEIYDKITTNWGKKEWSKELKLYDLLYPRKAFWKRLWPQPSTRREVLYFLSGSAIEKGLGEALGIARPELASWEDVFYRPDFFLTIGGTEELVELKSRRRALPEPGKEAVTFSSYLKQHLSYCVATDRKGGLLVVLSLQEKIQGTGNTEPVLAVYRVTYSDAELAERKEEMLKYKALILKGLEDHESWTELPLCPSWMCGKKLERMVKKPRCLTCKKDFANGYLLSRHLRASTGRGHDYTDGEYDTSFDKLCPYFDACISDRELESFESGRVDYLGDTGSNDEGEDTSNESGGGVLLGSDANIQTEGEKVNTLKKAAESARKVRKWKHESTPDKDNLGASGESVTGTALQVC